MNFTEEKITLKNGVRLILEPCDMVRSVCVGVWVNSGVVFENKKNNGVSHFIEHLLFKGTKNRSSFEISESVDAVGGQINAFSSKEFTCYFVKVRDEHWKLSLDLLSDMIKNSTFISAELEKERNVIIEEIKMYEDAPDEIIHDVFTSSIFKDYPIGSPILGTKKIIKEISRDEIIDYHSKMYTGPNIVITISGKFDSQEIKKFTEKSFGDIPTGNGEVIDSIVPVPTYETLIRQKDIEQVHLIVGADSVHESHEDRYKLSLLSTIIGGGMSSRLFQSIREERGLAYSVFSYTNRFRKSGLLAIYAGCAHNEAENVLELILKELNVLKKSSNFRRIIKNKRADKR
jgi:predicted Zn-dependent peptidase